MSLLGERGEEVNTSGCEPDIREFDSHRSPHMHEQRGLQRFYPELQPSFLIN